MKRLFCVRNARTGSLATEGDGSVSYFDAKEDAKTERDAYNKELKSPEWTVACGPDHRRYHEEAR